MAYIASSKTFETYNADIADGNSEIFTLVSGTTVSGTIANAAVDKPIPADGVLISVIGASGTYAGVTIDSDTGDFFRIPANTAPALFRIPIKRQIEINNVSGGTVKVSVGFIRGRNHF